MRVYPFTLSIITMLTFEVLNIGEVESNFLEFTSEIFILPFANYVAPTVFFPPSHIL